MAEDKAFAASPSRLAQARRDGDLPRSADSNVVVSVACAALALALCLDTLAGAARAALADAVRSRAFSPWPYATIACCAVAVAIAAASGALLATFAQSQTLVVKFPAPNIAKLDPIAGLKKMFSRDALASGAKASVVSLAVGATAIGPARDTFAATGTASSPAELAALVSRALAHILTSALAVAALFAVVDVTRERAKWKKRLRMSFDELKRDHKASDGDPLVRGRRRQAHRALVRGSIGRVREAAFVITNPTHVAIALEYRPPELAVPRVLVRAIDAGALEVKRRARELHVPIVEDVALARALLATTDVGDFIPADAYGAVAAIVASLVRDQAFA
ncbi:MAG: flagellar biosynthesis protein FlhB [Vulcanimicrobiaceae bacterium]